MRKANFIASAFALLLVCSSSKAQGFDQAKMDLFLDRIEQADQGMGSIAIYSGDREVYRRAIGYANVEDEAKADVNTHYRIGSISKTFTATLILQLVDEGRLNLDDKLDQFFPGIEKSDEITIEHLLNHRSGVVNYFKRPGFIENMYQPISEGDLLDAIIDSGIEFEPGSQYEYSNSNYVLLTWIAELASEATYNDLIQNKICEPCGLSDTYVGDYVGARPNEAKSYFLNDGWQHVPDRDLSTALGAGNIVSTASDVNKFLRCLLSSATLIKEETRDQMLVMQDGYGYGVFDVPFNGSTGYGHNGQIEGFLSNAYHFPELDVTIAYLGNGMVYPLNDILIGSLNIFLGRSFELPEFGPDFEVSIETLDSYVGTYEAAGFPLDVDITRSGNRLVGQATGQGSFYLTAVSEVAFTFDSAGLKLTFMPDGTMKLEQMGNEVIFS
ncbi:MAG: serine hydrolase domain-containing protein, partial [Bacteroidota bacterium]